MVSIQKSAQQTPAARKVKAAAAYATVESDRGTRPAVQRGILETGMSAGCPILDSP